MDHETKPRRKVNFFLNSKGGVGKSHHAALLVQAYKRAGLPVIAIDADATSASFSSFEGLGVERIDLMDGDAINPLVFDNISEAFLTKDANFVIDTGASAFVETNRYLLKNDIPHHIEAAGKQLVSHIIITGGSTFRETSANLEAIAAQMPESVEVIVWLNGHFGPIGGEGRCFQDFDVYQHHKDRIAGIVQLSNHTYTEKDTYGVDVKQMMTAGLSFDEVRASPDFTLMAKARLFQLEEEVNRKLAPIIEA